MRPPLKNVGPGKNESLIEFREVGVNPAKGEDLIDPVLAAVYVDEHLLARVQQDQTGQTALIAPASLTSYHIRSFRPGEEGKTPILAPKKITDWKTTVHAQC